MSYILNFIIRFKIDYIIVTGLFVIQQFIILDLFVFSIFNLAISFLLLLLFYILTNNFIGKLQKFRNNSYSKEFIRKFRKLIIILFGAFFVTALSIIKNTAPSLHIAVVSFVQFLSFIQHYKVEFNPYSVIKCITIFALLGASLFIYVY